MYYCQKNKFPGKVPQSMIQREHRVPAGLSQRPEFNKINILTRKYDIGIIKTINSFLKLQNFYLISNDNQELTYFTLIINCCTKITEKGIFHQILPK
jgi:hypothetical protein